MRNKTRILLWMLAAAILVGLAAETISVKKLGYEDIVLITPISSNSSIIDAERLEEINGDQFLLSYEILTGAYLEALNANFEVTLKMTNYTYRYLTDYEMVSGSFFTEEDQNRKAKIAVLNVAAAHAMFGSIDVCGLKVILNQEEYTITGVMDDDHAADGDDSEGQGYHVYIPASVSGQDPKAFVVQLNDSLNEAQVKNACKGFTVPESGYQYIHFGTQAGFVYGMLAIAFKILLICVLLAYLRRYLDRSNENIKQIGLLHGQYYYKEILHSDLKLVMKTAASTAAVVLAGLMILNLAFQLIESFLFWESSAVIVINSDASAFGEIASAQQNAMERSVFLLIGFIFVMVLLLSQSRQQKHILYQ